MNLRLQTADSQTAVVTAETRLAQSNITLFTVLACSVIGGGSANQWLSREPRLALARSRLAACRPALSLTSVCLPPLSAFRMSTRGRIPSGRSASRTTSKRKAKCLPADVLTSAQRVCTSGQCCCAVARTMQNQTAGARTPPVPLGAAATTPDHSVVRLGWCALQLLDRAAWAAACRH